MSANSIRRGAPRTDRVVDAIIYAVLILAAIVTLYPFLNVLAISLNDSTDSVRGGITIFPRDFTLRTQTIFTTIRLQPASDLVAAYAGRLFPRLA